MNSEITTNDPYSLQRFVDAQKNDFESARMELQQGCKVGHWIWFIFPQLKGLGRSQTSEWYGISSRDEAIAYLEHPILGPRLRECTQIVTLIEGRSIDQILGEDSVKFRSCMTLFANATPNNDVFMKALNKYFDGRIDPLTLDRL